MQLSGLLVWLGQGGVEWDSGSKEGVRCNSGATTLRGCGVWILFSVLFTAAIIFHLNDSFAIGSDPLPERKDTTLFATRVHLPPIVRF